MNSATESVEITSKGIRKVLNKYTPQRAIAEYIWNGFDAHAKVVKVYTESERVYDSITSIKVADDGDGIVYELLPVAFKRFYESHKSVKGNVDSRFSRGKNGYGRFTFFKFSDNATWHTRYKKEDEILQFSIDINSQKLTDYHAEVPGQSTEESTGTEVVFTDINNDDLSTPWVNEKLIPYLRAEFAWYFKVYPERKLYINDELLDCSSVIADSEIFDQPIELDGIDNELFHIYYFQWSEKPQDEFSRFYYMDADGNLKYQRTTHYNNKGDYFWHSVIVKSTFFNSLADIEDEENTLFSTLPERRIFKALNDKLNDYLGTKRRPFLREKAEVMVGEYESEHLFSFIGTSPWEENRKTYLQSFIKELYEVEPAVFTKLNAAQKKIFIRLLAQVMDTDHNDSLFKILGEVVDLQQDDKDKFATILETTKLKSIVATIQLIEDRLETINALRLVNFDHSLKAGEVKHLQKLIEKHYWIFGEEYRYICSEETKFQEALDKYKYALHGAKNKNEYIKHPDKYKEMDLFLSGQEFRYNRPFNLVVEIKNPTNVPELKTEHHGQLITYVDVIMESDDFQNPGSFWSFILIGNKIDSKVTRMMSDKYTGECPGGDNYKIYVKTWGQILDEAESRMKFLQEKFINQRNNLAGLKGADDVVEAVVNNTAAATDVR